MKRLLLLPFCLAGLVRAQADSIAPDATNMSTQAATDFIKGMRVGWNVGNSLEATGGETAWSNPLVTQALIDSVKAAGFNSIRLPVAWSQFSDASTFTIKTAWLDRVEVVANYALNRGMYVVLNEHWDGGWLQPTNAAKDASNKELAAIWKQVAKRFRNYGDHLLFAGTNEVMVTNDYSTPSAEYQTVQNGFNQTFVKTVRATGGRNAYRYLVFQTYNTNINYGVSGTTVPTDPASKRLFVEVHYYDPYEFTLQDPTTYTQWGPNAPDKTKVPTWGDEAYADGQFGKMKSSFADKGVPFIVGEYGVIYRASGCESCRITWDGYITGSIIKKGGVPFFWDNGYTTDKQMGVFNRANGTQAFPAVIKAIMDNAPAKADALAPVAVSGPGLSVRREAGALHLVREGPAAMARVLDLRGRVEREFPVPSGSSSLPLGLLPQGVHILRVDGDAPLRFLAD